MSTKFYLRKQTPDQTTLSATKSDVSPEMTLFRQKYCAAKYYVEGGFNPEPNNDTVKWGGTQISFEVWKAALDKVKGDIDAASQQFYDNGTWFAPQKTFCDWSKLVVDRNANDNDALRTPKTWLRGAADDGLLFKSQGGSPNPPATSNPIVALFMDLSYDYLIFPVIIGSKGVEKIVEINLTSQEKKNFDIYIKSKKFEQKLLRYFGEITDGAKAMKNFPVNGNDLSKMGYSGKAIGSILERLKKTWIDSDFKLNKKQLLLKL